MVLLPAARLLALTVRVAPDAVNGAVPSVVFPSPNVTLPAGTAVPLAGFTMAVSCVVAVDAMLAGFAVTDIVVETGAVTVTVVDAVALAKFPAGE
jgi:hypothetical protein